MRVMIFAFNPAHIQPQDLEKFSDWMMREFRCLVYFIPHLDNNAEPIYCVQFTDTKAQIHYGIDWGKNATPEKT